MKRKRVAEEQEREERIRDEVVVDCYNEEERAIGYYTYLENSLIFPFEATVCRKVSTNPLQEGETVRVRSMADSDLCLHGMWVTIEHQGSAYDIPLEQLALEEEEEEAATAIEDWKYWVDRGYQF